MMVTSSDQAVYIFVPVLAGVFLPVKYKCAIPQFLDILHR